MIKDPRILFTIGALIMGGKETQLLRLGELLREHVTPILGLVHWGIGNEYKAQVATCFSTNKQIQGWNIIGYYQLLKQFQPDVVFCWSRPTAYLTLIIKHLGKFSFAIINASIRSAPVHKNLQTKLSSLLYNLYPYVVANGEAGLKAFDQWDKPGRFILPNSLTPPNLEKTKKEYRAALGFPEDKFIITMVAGLKSTKDHKTFLQAIRECTKLNPDIVAYLAGEGPTRTAIEQWVKEWKLTNVMLLGKRPDISAILKASDLSVLCSTNGEGMPNAVLESLAVGTPVVATTGGGTDTLIQNGINGYLIGIGDYHILANIITKLKTNAEQLHQLENNTSAILDAFSADRALAAFNTILDTVLAKPYTRHTTYGKKAA